MLLSISNFLFYSSTGLFFFLPVYISELKVSKLYLGFIMGMPSIIQVAFGFQIRNKIDFINKKTGLLVTSIISIAVCIAYFFLNNIFIIPVIRFFHSLVLSVGILFGTALAIDLIPVEKRKSGIGLYSLTGALPFLFAPMTAEIIIKHFDFKYVFILAAIISLLRFIITLTVKTNGNSASIKKQDENTKISKYYSLIPFVIFYGALYAALYKFLSVYTIQLKIIYISIFFQVRVIFTFLSRIVSQSKLDKWKNISILSTSFISSFAVLFLGFILKFKPSVYILAIMGAIYGSVHGILYPALNVLFINITPTRTGKATIYFILIKNIGIAVFALLCGLIADYTGYNIMYLIMAILMLIPVLYGVFIRKRLEI